MGLIKHVNASFGVVAYWEFFCCVRKNERDEDDKVVPFKLGFLDTEEYCGNGLDGRGREGVFDHILREERSAIPYIGDYFSSLCRSLFVERLS